MIRSALARHRHTIRQLAMLIGEKGCRILIVALVGAFVARALGPTDYGHLNLALSLAFVVSPLARLGLEEILIRDIVREPDRATSLVGTGMALRLVGGLVPLACSLVALAFGLLPEPLVGLLPILLLMVCVQVLDTPTTFLLAIGRAGSVAGARLVSLLSGATLRAGGVLAHATLPFFAVTYVIESLIYGLGALWLARRAAPSMSRLRVEIGLLWPLLKECRYVAALYVVSDLAMRADILILAYFVDPHAVGVYAFGMRFVEALYALPVVAGTLVLQALARDTASVTTQRLVVQLGAIAFLGFGLVALTTASLASPIVWLLGGATYAEASAVMAISMLGLPLTAVGIVRYHYMLALGRLRLLAALSLTDAVLTILLAALFAWQWGIIGAAWAHSVSRALNLMITHLLVEDFRRLPLFGAWRGGFGLLWTAASGRGGSCLPAPPATIETAPAPLGQTATS